MTTDWIMAAICSALVYSYLLASPYLLKDDFLEIATLVGLVSVPHAATRCHDVAASPLHSVTASRCHESDRADGVYFVLS